MKEERQSWVPRPQTTADLIVVVFVGLVAVMLLLLTVGAICTSLFTDDDAKPFLAILTDLVTTLIAALVGFLAGRAAVNGKKGDQ
jgi:hypothetical protein